MAGYQRSIHEMEREAAAAWREDERAAVERFRAYLALTAHPITDRLKLITVREKGWMAWSFRSVEGGKILSPAHY